jgi:catechol 2,3-dioxygenase-like lactoylglutathione lyase family enzyme
MVRSARRSPSGGPFSRSSPNPGIGAQTPVTSLRHVRLNQVTLASSDLDRSVTFYARLGLRQIVADERYARFECPDGDSTLSLELSDSVPVSLTTVFFECDDLDAVVASLRAAGVAFDHEPVDQPWLWREARLRDPDGNPLCLFRAGENRLSPPWRLPNA